MRIVAMSDSHGRAATVQAIVERHLENADVFLHLGDGYRDFEQVQARYPHKEMIAVPGNCDRFVQQPETLCLSLPAPGGDLRILMTHGHRFSVKFGLEMLRQEAVSRGVQIAFFGHTHLAHQSREGDLYLLNPGSTAHPGSGKPGYLIVDVFETGIIPHFAEVPR